MLAQIVIIVIHCGAIEDHGFHQDGTHHCFCSCFCCQVTLQNVVTSMLASYRGYDTLGELAVNFTAGIGVLGLLGLRRRKRPGHEGGAR